ncbi:hypothetical protein EK21DRAFT_58220 [Setomelanomma holmii]|uniref:Uncharacterized protein n=1 Tax=Setomelanomma holmii TaxID=210430 RepID=A0A9P4HIN1_9PLEO|nr:hypothetical protein EK21DRAFT_58220 [Setomelanomma holmii]
MWTEFFDSEIWSRTMLQLSHSEPAIKHGILALSIMHERYESAAPVSMESGNDFAFKQYTQAVKHSKQLLAAHQEGRVSLEMVLIACIIFTCYENLAGNYHNANMHLRNGLRILEQNTNAAGQSTIAPVLYRFDLQAMTFSDNASMYNYELGMAPTCPIIADTYNSNQLARDDLVSLMRCLLWISGVVDRYPDAVQHPIWLATHQTMMAAFDLWEVRFAAYLRNADQRDPKIYAGNTLLKMSAIAIRIVMGAGAGLTSEIAYDVFLDNFKTIVDLAETIPILNPQSAFSTPSTSPSPSPSQTPKTVTGPSQPRRTQTQTQQSPRFSPSFELSPIVPLFIVACRCRDPTIRRRAIALLLSYRRREGVWDSLGAGMVAAKCMAREEDLPHITHINGIDGHGGVEALLVRNPDVRSCADVPEEKRVKDIFVRVEVTKGRVDLVYEMTTGERLGEKEVVWESRGDDAGATYHR